MAVCWGRVNRNQMNPCSWSSNLAEFGHFGPHYLIYQPIGSSQIRVFTKNLERVKLTQQFNNQCPTQIKVKPPSWSHGRVVEASDSKSDGAFLRKLESCWLRHFSLTSIQHIKLSESPKRRKKGSSLRKRKKVTQQFKMERPRPIIIRESDKQS